MVHLHTRSAYSLLESPFRIEQIVDMAIKYGFNHACLTDKRSMYGTMKFIKLCQEKGIHPIVGLEVDSVYQDQPPLILFCLLKMIGVCKIFML